MSHTALTSGALARICRGEDVHEPVLQVLGQKAITGSGQERFRLLLNDGEYSNSFAMLATQLNHLVHDEALPQYTVIKVKKLVCNQMANQGKRVVIVLDLEVLQKGELVAKKIGNPVTIGSDGRVPPPTANQNANPNAGAANAPKRPNENSMGGGPPNKAPTPSASVPAVRTSVMQPRPATGGSGPVVTPIASITPYQNKWTIKARVTSKGDVRTWNKSTGSGKLFSMDLMDESGAIRVTAFNAEVDRFYDYAQAGKVYYIANCSVKAANKQYSRIDNEYEMTFKDNGSMELVEEDTSDVPVQTYNFHRIADLDQLANDPNNAVQPDVMGICKSFGEAQDIVSKAGKELTKREIVLVDQSAAEVSLTLWGETAKRFDGSNQPVIAVKATRVSTFSGCTLSGGDMMIDPDIEACHELRGWWQAEGNRTSLKALSVQGQRGGDGGKERIIAEVKQEQLGMGSEKGEYYSTTATVSFFQKDKALYKACGRETDGRQCNKKVTECGGDIYRCEKCGDEKPGFAWRLMLQMNVADCTDNTWASCFQETAEKILDIKADELGRLQQEAEEDYNQVFAKACFKTYGFRMRVKADTYNDETRLKHSVVDASDLEYASYCKRLIQEIENAGYSDFSVPDQIDRNIYV